MTAGKESVHGTQKLKHEKIKFKKKLKLFLPLSGKDLLPWSLKN